MKELIIRQCVDLFNKYKLFIIYSLIGVTGATLDFIIYTFLIKKILVYYIFANIISVFFGITNNFLLNSFINFKLKDKLHRRFIKFFLVGIIGLIVSSILLFILIDFFHLNKLISKTITIGIIVLLQFGLNKKFTFRIYEKENIENE